jgi:hypothetical protein
MMMFGDHEVVIIDERVEEESLSVYAQERIGARRGKLEGLVGTNPKSSQVKSTKSQVSNRNLGEVSGECRGWHRSQ